jgi:DNA-binding beta-propeller fold protein YncE
VRVKTKSLTVPALYVVLLMVGSYFLRGQPAELVPADQPLGGDIIAVRSILDPHPAFNGIAVDPENNVAVISDTNRKSVLVYDRGSGGNQSQGLIRPLRQIIGPETNIGFVAGVVLNPQNREIFAVNNDIEDTMVVMPYNAEGNAKPSRLLAVPHQAWGLALSPSRDEIAVSVEIQNAIVFYRRTANGVEAPLRSIQGPQTGMADPHGIYWDDTHTEIGVANHGNFRGLAKNVGLGCVPATDAEVSERGRFQLPSITIYSATSKGDTKPLRTIQGPKTKLDWPMGISADTAHNEIAVANNGDDSILIFQRTAQGDAAPVRVIRGSRTGISRPMGVAIDTKHGEIWVSNFGDHTAVVFPRNAAGNVPPTRVIRSAPAGAPSTGFGNPMAVAYDSKRQEILVPN